MNIALGKRVATMEAAISSSNLISKLNGKPQSTEITYKTPKLSRSGHGVATPPVTTDGSKASAVHSSVASSFDA
jgi:hypothetical protein